MTDQQGNFVRNLTKDDFQVFEQGKPQTVSVASLVDIPVEKFDPPLFKTKPIEPDVRSNRKEFDGRVFVIVLDDLNTSFSRSARVKLAARQFIERYLGANDVAAIVQTGGAKSTGQEFTSSRERLLRAVDNFMGQKERSATLERIDDYYRTLGTGITGRPRDPNEAIRVYKARNTFTVLKNVADYMAGIRGRRKAVVFFSEGIDYDIYDPISNTYATDIRQYSQDAIAAATRANVSFYGVDPRGLAGFDDAAEIASLPNDPSLGLGLSALQRELQHLAGQPAHALGRNRRVCRGQLERLRQELRADHPGQQQLLRARVLLERHQARRPVPHPDRPGEAAGPAGAGAQGVRRAEEAGRPRARQRRRASPRRSPCARRSTAPCRSPGSPSPPSPRR